MEFKNPPVSPRDSEERKSRAEFKEALRAGEFSSALGWIISLGKKLEDDLSAVQKLSEGLQKEQAFAERPRETCGWSVLYYFTL